MESNVESSHQKDLTPLKNYPAMNNTMIHKENNDDCPPTSKNSILRIKPYLCDLCSKRYATPFTLKRHRKKNTFLQNQESKVVLKF